MTKHDIVGKKEIDDSGNAHRQHTAEYNIPPFKAFYQQYRSQSEKKDHGTGKVICQVLPYEISEISLCRQTVSPDIKIEDREIDQNGGLKRKHRRDHIFSPITIAKGKGG